jgi:hypothetical protein
MKLKSLFCLLGIICIVSCKKNNTSLISLVPAIPIVNPNTSIILRNNNLIDVQLRDSDLIKGMTDSLIFQTQDYFDGFEYAPITNPQDFEITSINKDRIVKISNYGAPFIMTYSLDYGLSWSSHITPDFTNHNGDLLVDTWFKNDSTILFLMYGEISGQFNTDHINVTNLFSVNLRTQQVSLLYSLQGTSPQKICFINDKTGWLLIEGNTQQNTMVIKTTDGGLTFSAPVLIANDPIHFIAAGSSGNVFAFDGDGSSYYSVDSGNTWKQTNSRLRFTKVVYTASAMFAATGGEVSKSEDEGNNWENISNTTDGVFVSGNSLDFFNDEYGIVYSPDKLFITKDGGASWKILLCPYPYIIN